MPGDLGRRHASVSGDMNPIHMHPLSATAVRLPDGDRAWDVDQRAVPGGAPSSLPDSFGAEVQFRKPILLPATVEFGEAADPTGIAFSVRAPARGRRTWTAASASAEPEPSVLWPPARRTAPVAPRGRARRRQLLVAELDERRPPARLEVRAPLVDQGLARRSTSRQHDPLVVRGAGPLNEPGRGEPSSISVAVAGETSAGTASSRDDLGVPSASPNSRPYWHEPSSPGRWVSRLRASAASLRSRP